MAVLQDLQYKLNNLKKNREAISEEELKTKYARAYNTLLCSIGKLKNQMITDALSGIRIPRNKAEAVKNHWEKTQKNINHALYEEYDVRKAQEILESFVTDIFIEFNSVKIYQLEE